MVSKYRKQSSGQIVMVSTSQPRSYMFKAYSDHMTRFPPRTPVPVSPAGIKFNKLLSQQTVIPMFMLIKILVNLFGLNH